MLVSGRHVGANLDEHQDRVSIQISITLGKKFLRISSIRKSAVTWILARRFAYLPSFLFSDSGFSLLNGFDFPEWRDTENQQFVSYTRIKYLRTHIISVIGALIRDGDRTLWDRRAPMIWDTFAIFRTNFATLKSYIRADPRTSRVDVVTLRNQFVRVEEFHADFSQRWQQQQQQHLIHSCTA